MVYGFTVLGLSCSLRAPFYSFRKQSDRELNWVEGFRVRVLGHATREQPKHTLLTSDKRPAVTANACKNSTRVQEDFDNLLRNRFRRLSSCGVLEVLSLDNPTIQGRPLLRCSRPSTLTCRSTCPPKIWHCCCPKTGSNAVTRDKQHTPI